MGYTSIGDKRIYGKYFNYGSFGPVNIPRSVFNKNKELLEEVEYDEKILGEMFGCYFPPVRFKISELHRLDITKLVEIAKLMGIQYISNRTPTHLEGRALRKSVISHLTD